MDEATFVKLISDGMKPDCFQCGSQVEYNGPQKGTSGANGYNYNCSGADCSVSGFAYIPWHRVLLKALQTKILQLGILIIGSISISGTAAYQLDWITFSVDTNKQEQSKPSELTQAIETFQTNLQQKDQQIVQLQENILSLQHSQIKEDDKINLGIYYALPSITDPGYRNNSDLAKKYLFAAVNNDSAGYSDKRWYEIIRALVMVRESIKSDEEFELLLKLIRERYKDKEKELALAEVYWAYAIIGNLQERYSHSIYHFITLATMRENLLTQGQINDIKRMLDKLADTNTFISQNKDDLYASLGSNDLPKLREFRSNWGKIIGYSD